LERIELEQRTKGFAFRVLSFVSALTRSRAADVLGHQLLKSGTSIGANYRKANRAATRADFINKINIVEKEAAETLYWIELCGQAGLGRAEDRSWLLRESTELLAIFTAIGKTTKSNSKSAVRNPKS
jgi:four helix bundle protein